MTRQQLLCAVISRNNDNAFRLQSCLGMSGTVALFLNFWRLKTAVAAQSLSRASAFRQSRLQSTDDFKFPTCR